MKFFVLISKLFLAKQGLTFRSFSVNLAPFHNQVNNVINLFIMLFLFSQGFLGLFGWNTVDSEAKEVCYILLSITININSTIQLNNFILD